MTEAFEHKGIWWLPDRPERRIYGTLNFDPVKGATLDLFGSMRIKGDEFPFQSDIICGEFSNGKPITLCFCNEKQENISIYALTRSPGFPQTKIGVQYVFEGQHFLSVDEVRFNSLKIEFSHLNNWADKVGIESGREEREVTLKYSLPDNFKMNIEDVGGVILLYGCACSPSHNSAAIRKYSSIKIETSDLRNFKDWWRIIYLFRVFFTLAARNTVHPTSLEEVKEVEVEYPDGTIGKSFLCTSIFFKNGEMPDDSRTEGQRGMLFSLADLGDSFETCLQNWFKKAEQLEPVYELYFGTIHKSDMHGIHQFLSLMQAIESYHRRTSNSSTFPTEEWRSRVTEITDAVPEHLKVWVREKLNFSNELSLRQRLGEIMATYESIFGTSPDSAAFIKMAVDTRNYLTHYDSSSKKKAAHGSDLILLSRSVKILVEMCLLKELGLSERKICHILSRGQKIERWFEHPPQPTVDIITDSVKE